MTRITASPGLVGVVVIVAVLVAILALAAWSRSRERRDEWGPGLVNVPAVTGYTPADLRDDGVPGAVDDPTERWLLGLAAPFVEQAALLHHRWSLVPADCSDQWRRHLLTVATRWNATRAREWASAVEALEQRAVARPAPGWTDERPWAVANLAMLLRLGVAARHTNASCARKRLLAAASGLRADYHDWLAYGDAVLTLADGSDGIAALRAGVRTLYAPDGPWQDPSWNS